MKRSIPDQPENLTAAELLAKRREMQARRRQLIDHHIRAMEEIYAQHQLEIDNLAAAQAATETPFKLKAVGE